MRVALDTNVLVYAAGVNGPAHAAAATMLIERLAVDDVVVPAQALGELFRVLVRKDRRAPRAAQMTVLFWADAFRIAPTTAEAMVKATDLAAAHQVDIWDAVVMAAAADAQCRVLLSEDLQDGFTWNGLTVVNPFAPVPHKLLASVVRPVAG